MLYKLFMLAEITVALPLLLGMLPHVLLCRMTNTVRFVSVYTVGCLLEWAMFFSVSYRFVAHADYYTLGDLTTFLLRWMPVITLVLLVADALLLCRNMRLRASAHREEARMAGSLRNKYGDDGRTGLRKPDILFVVIPAALIFLSVMFVVPSVDDWTLEHVQQALRNQSLYNVVETQYDLTISQNVSLGEPAWPCLYLFYAFTAMATHLSAATLVHLAFGVLYLLFFFCAYAHMGHLLFPEEEQAGVSACTKRRVFFLLAVGFFAVQLFVRGYVAEAVFQNIWNQTTLGASCVLPLTVVYGVKLADWIADLQRTREYLREGFFLLIVLAACAASLQLMLVWGGVFWLIIVVISAAIGTGRSTLKR